MSLHCHSCGNEIEPGRQRKARVQVGTSQTSATGLYWDQWYSGSSTHYADVWFCASCYENSHRNDWMKAWVGLVLFGLFAGAVVYVSAICGGVIRLPSLSSSAPPTAKATEASADHDPDSKVTCNVKQLYLFPEMYDKQTETVEGKLRRVNETYYWLDDSSAWRQLLVLDPAGKKLEDGAWVRVVGVFRRGQASPVGDHDCLIVSEAPKKIPTPGELSP